MNSRNKKIKIDVLYFITALLMLLIWGYSLWTVENIKKLYPSVSIRIHGEGIKISNVKKALKEAEDNEQEVPQVTLWNMNINDKIDVINETLMKTTRIPVVYVNGDMMTAMSVKLMSGNFPYSGDDDGCVIDENTAWSLFETGKADGGAVVMEDREYQIRGIVKSDKSFIMIQSNNNIAFNNMEIVYKEAKWGKKNADEFMFQNNPGIEYTIIDSRFYGEILDWAVHIPLWIFALLIMIRWWIPRGFSQGCNICKIKILKKCVGVFLAASGCIIVFLLLYKFWSSPVYIPHRWIPNRWSDFEYWSRLLQDIRLQWEQLRYLIPNPKDIYIIDSIKQCLWGVASGCICGVFVFDFIYNSKWNKV